MPLGYIEMYVTWSHENGELYDFNFLFVKLLWPTNHYTPRNEVRGGILDSPCLSVCPSVRLSVR